ncbi:MAG: anti-sigma factor [Candidatus Dormibacter sp.]
MISCQDADVLAAALSVGSIDAGDEATLQEHLTSCADCRRIAGDYLAAAARLPLALEPMQPSPELRGRLMRAVYAEAEQASRRRAAARTTWWRRLWATIPTARGFTLAGAVAIVAAIAVSSWTVVRQPAPTAVAVPLTATVSAPSAHGQVVYDRGGSQAVVTVTGLPAPSSITAGGAVYEVWLIPTSGVPVGAAFLSRQPDGTWSAAVNHDISGYSAIAATVEPVAGSRSPTGPRVLQAPLGN